MDSRTLHTRAVAEGVANNNMNIDSPYPPSVMNIPCPLFFGLSTPALPPTTVTTPLSAEDPIGDALTTIFHAIAGQD
jgi:hypothetical protein